MDILLIVAAAIFLILGVLGSFLPILPGIPLSWLGLLLLHLTATVPMDYTFLSFTLLVAIVIFALQYAIPALGTKYLGGSKRGMYGATIGLIAGVFIPIPFAILIAPFVGAYLGEILNKSNSRHALRAASGSFIGLIASAFMEFVVTGIFLLLFIYRLWEYKGEIFSW
ncbi:hypothetical protein SAMN04488034_101817 [Salinimicrobium catena]|uniref:DUF456 domain-containing protein n=1 Tax=Salinimicrobium catena TaxID=390640 RepID=A0A1H5JRS9_9FLAO|nr:DUF456 domain-containing protein [Salinimicrobium catena]SDK89311.1 hypothetical protein SAMN04488140_101803 [Salinimicrobium catena]SEE54661.1 hypothetical protein SAMN04488034_101817 [Salinimicrobium catena]